MAGARLFFKCENLQKVGAFKFRGACNAVLSLADERGAPRRGHPLLRQPRRGPGAGRPPARHPRPHRHAPHRARGSNRRRWPATAAASASASPRWRRARRPWPRSWPTPAPRSIHPYNDPRVIAGQGTAALELLEDVPDLDIVIAPVGGGGLLSGTALAAEGLAPGARSWRAEPAGADDACRSLREGRIVPSRGPAHHGRRPADFARDEHLRHHPAAGGPILTVSEDAIVAAMRLVWERMKIVIEPSSAVPVAALLGHPDVFRGACVGVILSGGNADLDHLPWQ